MRTQQLALAAALATAVFAAHAAPARLEPANSPFTWEVLGATPSLTFGRAAAQPAERAPQAVEATKAAEAPKPAAVPQAAASEKAAPARAPGATATSPFTWDALGATPHVELKKQPVKREAQAPAAAH